MTMMNEYLKNRYRTNEKFRDAVKKRWAEGNFKYKVCPIIRKHAETMKDDPEHLSTEFILSLLGRERSECGDR